MDLVAVGTSFITKASVIDNGRNRIPRSVPISHPHPGFHCRSANPTMFRASSREYSTKCRSQRFYRRATHLHGEALRIPAACGVIAYICMRVHTSCEPHRILTQPAADNRIVPAVEVVLKARVGIERPAGEKEQRIDRWVGFAGNVAKGIVHDVVHYRRGIRSRIVLGDVPHGVQVVGERPLQKIRCADDLLISGKQVSHSSRKHTTPSHPSRPSLATLFHRAEENVSGQDPIDGRTPYVRRRRTRCGLCKFLSTMLIRWSTRACHPIRIVPAL